MKTVIMFPGQGELRPGMALDLIESLPLARSYLVFLERITGLNVEKLLRQGSAQELGQLKNAQLTQFIFGAILGDSLRIEPSFVAGHSLGEITGLYRAGAFSLEDAIGLVAKRAELLPSGAMAWVSARVSEVRRVLQAYPNVAIAAINGPEAVNLTGWRPDVERVVSAFKELRIRAIVTKVQAVSHSPLLETQSERLRAELEKVRIGQLRWPMVTANWIKPLAANNPGQVRDYLSHQLITPVRWEELVQNLSQQGVERFVELACSPWLGGLVEKIVPGARVGVINSFESLKAFRN